MCLCVPDDLYIFPTQTFGICMKKTRGHEVPKLDPSGFSVMCVCVCVCVSGIRIFPTQKWLLRESPRGQEVASTRSDPSGWSQWTSAPPGRPRCSGSRRSCCPAAWAAAGVVGAREIKQAFLASSGIRRVFWGSTTTCRVWGITHLLDGVIIVPFSLGIAVYGVFFGIERVVFADQQLLARIFFLATALPPTKNYPGSRAIKGAVLGEHEVAQGSK